MSKTVTNPRTIILFDRVKEVTSATLFQVWDEELAVKAQQWANQCINGHDSGSARRVGKIPSLVSWFTIRTVKHVYRKIFLLKGVSICYPSTFPLYLNFVWLNLFVLFVYSGSIHNLDLQEGSRWVRISPQHGPLPTPTGLEGCRTSPLRSRRGSTRCTSTAVASVTARAITLRCLYKTSSIMFTSRITTRWKTETG